MLKNFKILLKILIDSPYERLTFLDKNCLGDYVFIKKEQLKPNNDDWLTIDHTIVSIKFLNLLKFGLKAYQRRIAFLPLKNILPIQQIQPN